MNSLNSKQVVPLNSFNSEQVVFKYEFVIHDIVSRSANLDDQNIILVNNEQLTKLHASVFEFLKQTVDLKDHQVRIKYAIEDCPAYYILTKKDRTKNVNISITYQVFARKKHSKKVNCLIS